MFEHKKISDVPELLNLWDYEKNVGIDPSLIFITDSRTKCWWKCPSCGESRYITPYSMFRSKTKICRKCYLKCYRHVLSEEYPDITAEWNYEKNELKPEDYSVKSNKRVWWQCQRGHVWKTAVSNRTANKSGCPYCARQKAITGENDLITLIPEIENYWDYEKNGNLNPKELLCGSMYKVWWKCDKGHEWQDTVKNQAKHKNCPFCANRKTTAIIEGFNDLSTMYPDIAKEWDYKKNGDILPTQIAVNSRRKVWWKCSAGHEWIERITCRTFGNTKCPICNHRKILVPGYNDLATLYPEIAAEWNYEKNGDLTPDKVFSKSRTRVWWKCSKCGREWNTSVHGRTNMGAGCVRCSMSKRKKNLNKSEEPMLDVKKVKYPCSAEPVSVIYPIV